MLFYFRLVQFQMALILNWLLFINKNYFEFIWLKAPKRKGILLENKAPLAREPFSKNLAFPNLSTLINNWKVAILKDSLKDQKRRVRLENHQRRIMTMNKCLSPNPNHRKNKTNLLRQKKDPPKNQKNNPLKVRNLRRKVIRNQPYQENQKRSKQLK